MFLSVGVLPIVGYHNLLPTWQPTNIYQVSKECLYKLVWNQLCAVTFLSG